ncbi:hypothetical protein [Aquiflexum sp.]|uniref:hypothetical protein n=1 Tax=Aquiflexum sp. TaxID=1872584 RepID=UPI0035948D5E
MKKNQKKESANLDKGVLSRLNDNPDQKEKVSPSDKEKGILSELNDDPEKKK